MYRYLIAPFGTGVPNAELVPSTCSYESVLNGVGSISLTIDLDPKWPGQADVLTADMLLPARTCLYVERDGVLQWGGILWARTPDVDAETYTLAGSGFGSYWAHRELRETKTYAQVDQALIVADVLAWAQAQPAGDLGIDLSALTAMGVPRDRTWYGYERKQIGSLISDMSDDINGFDFAYDSDWLDEHTIGTRLLLTPRGGRETDFMFELGDNCTFTGFTGDGTTIVTRADALGAGQAETQLIATSPQDGPLANGWPLLEDSTSYSDISDPVTLQAKADRAVQEGSGLLEIPTVRVTSLDNPPLGAYQVGDVVRVRGDAGLLQVDGSFKITTLKVEVDENGTETPTLTLAPAGLFST